jgi:tRNA pseudouridine55 synthase
LFGIINLNKPVGITSHDAVQKIRRIFKIKQVGHSGTLDPFAQGVLPMFIGKATKLIQYFDTSKIYRAYIKLGISTDTYDSEGKILQTLPVILDLDKITKALATFQGEITQTPPMHSAVHYKGKRLYEYARKNIEIDDIPQRQVTINSIKLLEIKDKTSENPIITVDIDCSGGTYIRSIANDLGNLLGYGAYLENLERTKSGKFNLTDSLNFEQIEESFKTDKVGDILINPLDVLDLAQIEINTEDFSKIQKGQFIDLPENINLEEEQTVLLVSENKILAVAFVKENNICPRNVFI